MAALNYSIYEAAHDVADTMRPTAIAGVAGAQMTEAGAKLASSILHHPLNPMRFNPLAVATVDAMLEATTNSARWVSAACETFERKTRRYDRPDFNLPTTKVDGQEVAVREEVVMAKPFMDLVHFKRDLPEGRAPDSNKLLVAPMSGHYATLLRGTVETDLPHYNTYITDWHNPRDVPVTKGAEDFDLDDYVDYLIDTFRSFKGNLHVDAVCQPSVPVMVAIAMMEEDNDPYGPMSVTLRGGPIDTRINPTPVNTNALKYGLNTLRKLFDYVPSRYAGFGRLVAPGFAMLHAFKYPNMDKHMKADHDHFMNLVRGDGDSAEKHRVFYDEYEAVMDPTARYVWQTNVKVFFEHHLPRGIYKYREGTSQERLIDLTKIHRVALMTIEGEKDDITGKGQTHAAQALCPNIPDVKRVEYTQPGVGHYGIFNGSRHAKEVAPKVRDFTSRVEKMRNVMPFYGRTARPSTGNGSA
ncbi:MAG: polyhydroxyalkanoate depolymerase [Alphaproteobacteria bacterium]|nr:polyhydroxyalkanoate depolymerase [Alphaproteobacteria bacterium]